MTRERMRVARELHDAVAHNISVIAIQAGGADGIVERDPDRAAQSAELIEAVAREALAELGRLTDLRPPSDGGAPAEPRARRPLADRARAGGLPVELRRRGPRRPRCRRASTSPRSGSCRRRWPTPPSTPAPTARG